MARCVCNNPCTCYFEYDGDRPNTVYTLPYQNGRYSTRKTGSGTVADPFVVEFLDSEEFKVEAGQARISTDRLLSSATSSFQAQGFDIIDYETPGEIFLAFVIQMSGGLIFPSAHKFWFVTAEATFVNNGSNNGSRRIHVQWHPPADLYGTYSEFVITGNSATPVAEDMVLSCSGMIPFLNFREEINFNGPMGYINIGLQQNSGSTLTVRGVRMTLVAI